ncbi:MAG TPA: hypothetical protein VF588_16960 [Pyrinomonadaceae bacterium]|jgi:hypothetical protein
MTEPVYEPFDEDRVRLILLEEIYYLMRAADGQLRDAAEEGERALSAAAVAAIGKAAKERMSALRAQRRAG